MPVTKQNHERVSGTCSRCGGGGGGDFVGSSSSHGNDIFNYIDVHFILLMVFVVLIALMVLMRREKKTFGGFDNAGVDSDSDNSRGTDTDSGL